MGISIILVHIHTTKSSLKLKTHKTHNLPLLNKLGKEQEQEQKIQNYKNHTIKINYIHPPYLGWILGPSLVWIPTLLFFSLFFSSFSSLHKFSFFPKNISKYLFFSLYLFL